MTYPPSPNSQQRFREESRKEAAAQGLRRSAQVCAGLCGSMRVYASLYGSVRVYAGLCGYVRVYTGLCGSMRVYPDLSSAVLDSVLACSTPDDSRHRTFGELAQPRRPLGSVARRRAQVDRHPTGLGGGRWAGVVGEAIGWNTGSGFRSGIGSGSGSGTGLNPVQF